LPVTELDLENVGPFDKIDFKFDRQVNVFVGPNNSGKTSALVALAEIVLPTFVMPRKLLRTGARFRIGMRGNLGGLGHGADSSFTGGLPIDPKKDNISPNVLGYRTYIPALRISTDFRSSGPEAKKPKTQDPLVQYRRYLSDEKEDSGIGTLWIEDKKTIQQMVELDYRSYRENKPAVRQVLNHIAELASEITEGFPIQFVRIGEDDQGLFPVFKTLDGELPLHVLSQGTQSLIQWCARLLIGYAEHYRFPESLAEKLGVLIIDEIDAHLHPSWQRRVLPAITKHLPNLQIFCATHSPMTVAGLKAGQIQLLTRNSQGKVCVSTNHADILGWSADEIYSSFLGVEPTDLATAQKLERLRLLRDKAPLTSREEKELQKLREEMHRLLTGGSLTDRAEELAASLKDAAAASGRKPVHGNGKSKRERVSH